MPRLQRWLTVFAGSLCAVALSQPAAAQKIENFNTVTETGGGEILDGSGSARVTNWDNGITGEKAFAATEGSIQVSATVAGDNNAGVGATGAGVMHVLGLSFNILAEDFETAQAPGTPTMVVDGNGTPDVFNAVTNWDNGLTGENAFGGAYGGAVLNGDITAQALATGGVSGSKAGQIDVTNVASGAGGWYAGLQWNIGPLPGSAPGLTNGGFESGLTGWTKFANVYASGVYTHTGTGSVLMYGPFNGRWDASGMWQYIDAEPGQQLELSFWGYAPSADALQGGNFVFVRIDFFNAGGTKIGESASPNLITAATAQDTWAQYTHTATTPAGTVRAQCLFYFIQDPNKPGAVYVDDATFGVAGGGAPLNLHQFELTAQVKGAAGGAGETLGQIELRIEDSDGDRLVFTKTATTSFQTIGGLLDTAQERGADNVPAAGVFNTHSRSFKVIVGFGGSATWGTGGTVIADNLVFGSASLAGSDFSGGFLWDGLSLPSADPADMTMTADVKGSVVGGAYTLKLEAVDVVEAGIDEDFDTITTDTEIIFFDQAAINGGGNYVGFANWNDQIEGESVFGGVYGPGVSFFDQNSYISVSGLASGGNGGGGAGQLFVDGVIYQDGSGWYAGMSWPNQGLASTDLSQVMLTADVKGETAPLTGLLGEIELRIEDGDGDRLVFHTQSTGSWQSIGGPLSTAEFAPQPEGQGNGVFDLYSASYTVIVAFGDITGWMSGGVISADNVYLTPVQIRNKLGSFSFDGVANGSFQSIGGPLSAAVSTLATGKLDDSFEGGAGEGVDFFTGGAGGSPGGFDSGLEGEDAFGGTWGTGATLGLARAESCLTCGVGGTKGARLLTSGVSSSASGGWWAGLMWTNQPANLSDLAVCELSADIKGVPTGAGGLITLRIEDSAGNYIAFVTNADGAFHSIGGSLLNPDRTGQRDNPVPDPIPNPYRLNLDEGVYSVVLVISGTDTEWLQGGSVIVDNLYFAGTGITADDYELSVEFKDGVATWGTDATLTIDNVRFFASPDMDGDGDVDLADYAEFQGCFSGSGNAAPSGCEAADVDGDGDVDLIDLAAFVSSVTGV